MLVEAKVFETAALACAACAAASGLAVIAIQKNINKETYRERGWCTKRTWREPTTGGRITAYFDKRQSITRMQFQSSSSTYELI